MSWLEDGNKSPVGKVSAAYFCLSRASRAYSSTFFRCSSANRAASYSCSFFDFGGINITYQLLFKKSKQTL